MCKYLFNSRLPNIHEFSKTGVLNFMEKNLLKIKSSLDCAVAKANPCSVCWVSSLISYLTPISNCCIQLRRKNKNTGLSNCLYQVVVMH